jgi:large subunit ribosomal protein L22
VLRFARISPYKVREVLDLIRGKPVGEAEDILRFTERDAGIPVTKLLRSAIANAETNDSQDPEELYVSACFADEATTIKRWRPRARGRATRIRKRTSHVTIIVSRLPEHQLVRLQARRQAEQAARRARRVAGARRASGEAGRNRAARRRRGGAEMEPVAAQEPIVSEEPAAEELAAEETTEHEGRLAEEPAAEETEEHEGPLAEEPAAEETEEHEGPLAESTGSTESADSSAEAGDDVAEPDEEKGK